MEKWLSALKEKYVGRYIHDNAETEGLEILKKHGASYNLFDPYEISLSLIDRTYYTSEELEELEQDYIDLCEEMDEEPDEFYCEEMNWTISCLAVFELQDGMITAIRIEHNVYGDEGLGEYDPDDIYSDDEWKLIQQTVSEYLQAICR